MNLSVSEIAAILAVLANGIIPADGRDQGAAEVDAGPVLAERVESGILRDLYLQGVENAELLAGQHFGTSVCLLETEKVYDLMMLIKSHQPGFFKQLRMDVSALYLSDPNVLRRIGFPGASAERGGYPDFDQPQKMLKAEPTL
ncbi:gluconate 2-dehydrogenase subunit 3 family protein [Peribacillus deserti]|uniref:Gluconate 2-dehydrogenase subunit 3 family protein n=1 Tax=Peribacillus deserti TaxID=673318 RepID=A0A2N5M4Z1_9BACI|nr:gluconate 2-dehydrogenase subunit 3 family protein [Peribacillus deserti]PLT29402.1 hypothetical protein CUU66_13330 [Peribacillus deserti]